MRIAPFAVFSLLFICGPALAGQRSFVASYGNDANSAGGCVFANPCRSFTSALSVTDPGGEIVAIDAAGYGIVTITKSVTITANPGFYAGITASSGATGVTINTGSINVILRGLNINGLAGSVKGVAIAAGATVTIENCVISNFQNGVSVSNSSGRLRISDSVVRGNSEDGIYVENGGRADVYRTKVSGNALVGMHVNGDIAATTSRLMVSDSEATGNGIYGFLADVGAAGSGNARMSITRSTASFNGTSGIAAQSVDTGTVTLMLSNSAVSFNTTGIEQAGVAVFNSQGNNAVSVNTTNTTGTITVVGGT